LPNKEKRAGQRKNRLVSKKKGSTAWAWPAIGGVTLGVLRGKEPEKRDKKGGARQVDMAGEIK